MSRSIFDAHKSCYTALQLLSLEVKKVSDGPFYSRLRRELDKYTLWADSVGAIHPEDYTLSLDHRLRYASSYKKEVSMVHNEFDLRYLILANRG